MAKAKAKPKKPTALTVQFDNHETMKHFASWLCEAGEQDYWQWMDCRVEDEGCTPHDIKAYFDYRNAKLGVIIAENAE